jgi:hypothetical protein
MKFNRVQPDDIGAHINVGRTFNSLMKHEESEQAYRTALSLLPPVKPGLFLVEFIRLRVLNVSQYTNKTVLRHVAQKSFQLKVYC